MKRKPVDQASKDRPQSLYAVESAVAAAHISTAEEIKQRKYLSPSDHRN